MPIPTRFADPGDGWLAGGRWSKLEDMVTVDTSASKPRLSTLLATVERGETVLICRGGLPVAELRPVKKVKDPLRVHPELSRIEFFADPAAPLDPEDWPEADPGR